MLGEVEVPSGKVLVVDTGLLGLWSHDPPPLVEEGRLEPSTREAANSSVDLRIEGPDAERAEKACGREVGSTLHVFDVPRAGLAEFRTTFDARMKTHGLRARVVELPGRVPHRARIDLALASAPAGNVSFHGMWAVAASSVPRGRTLRVLGERMRSDEFEDRWRFVWLELERDAEVARSEPAGDVMVDWARLMFVDVDALGAWNHDEPIDGKADFVFWGLDAAKAARALKAPALSEDEFGWKDLPIEAIVPLGTAVEEHREEHELKFATDFRPHSHHHFVMDQIRTTPTSSVTLEVGGAKLCAFHTTWGDGSFPVLRDLDGRGRLVRLRIDLGNDETVEAAQRLCSGD